MAEPIFVTGMYRSGTTLLEKLLHSHPGICLASQPYPLLFFYAKQAFLDELSLSRRYPLEDCFLEEDYHPQDFHAFLDEHRFSQGFLRGLFDDLADYKKGLWTPEMLQFGDRIQPGRFLHLFEQLNACIAELFPKPQSVYLGLKDVLFEEYVPYLLNRGVKVVISLRDPRATVASLSGGCHEDYTGAVRPTLYNVRLWRKSVATVLGCEDHPAFHWLRYEDLVTDTPGQLRRLCQFLELDDYAEDAFAEGIRDQWGNAWRGNSSYNQTSGVNTEPLTRFRSLVPAETIAYIESCCLPELKLLGYELFASDDFSERALRQYQEPFPVDHPKFPSNYSLQPDHLQQEIRRYEMLREKRELPASEARCWFLHPLAYARLKDVVGGQGSQEISHAA